MEEHGLLPAVHHKGLRKRLRFELYKQGSKVEKSEDTTNLVGRGDVILQQPQRVGHRADCGLKSQVHTHPVLHLRQVIEGEH